MHICAFPDFSGSRTHHSPGPDGGDAATLSMTYIIVVIIISTIIIVLLLDTIIVFLLYYRYTQKSTWTDVCVYIHSAMYIY